VRDLTKSLFSFSWATMVYGTKQFLGAFQPRGAAAPSSNVKSTAPQGAGDFFDRTFKAGDTLQRGLVDMMFGSFSPNAVNPIWWLKMSVDTMRRSAGAFQQASSKTAPRPDAPSVGTVAPGSASTGWGPMS
jgi:hypothetical protein